MKHSYSRSVLVSLFGLALASQACTVVTKNADDDGSEDSGVATDDSETDDTSGTDTEDDTDVTDTDTDTDTDVTDDTDPTSVTDTSEPDAGGTSADDAGVAADAGEGTSDDTTGDAGETSADDAGEPTDEDAGSVEPPVVSTPTFTCGDPELDGALVLDGTIDTDQTWSGVVLIEGEVRVSDAEITIEPGTQFVMGADSRIEFGWNSAATTVFANGTADAPITFCGQDPEAGFFSDVAIGSNVTSNSELHNVLVSSGGGNGAALFLGANVLVDNVVVRDSGDVGVRAVDFESGSQGLFVHGSLGAAVELTTPSAATEFPVDSNLTGNDSDIVVLDYSDIEGEVVYHDLGVPYYQPESVDVNEAELTIEAGVEIIFAADAVLEVGWNFNDATLNITGTESNPVVFRGDGDTPGFWRGVLIQSTVRTDSSIEYLELRNAGGGDNYALDVASPITISHVTLSDNETGARIGAQGLAEGSTDWTVTATSAEPLTITPNTWAALPASGAFTGNEVDEILVVDMDFYQSGTVPNLGVPYAVQDGVRILDGASMTIEAGTQFIMAADTLFDVGWNFNEATLIALGTEDAPITFIGNDDAPGYWVGIEVGSEATSDSELQWVEVQYAGGGDPSAALTLRAPVDVSNCTFADSAGFGILKTEGDENAYTGNTFENNAEGDVGTL